MPSPESEDETRPAEEAAAAERAKSDEPAWPPAEARPEEAASSPAELAASTAKPAEPEQAAAPEQGPAAEPNQEMGLSESTLHWLVDGEKAIEPVANDPGTAPHYDPRAPVAGRKRTVVVIGGAAVVAFVVAVVLHGQAARNRAAAGAPPVVRAEPAAVLTQRAEAALAQGRSAEALDLANLALGSDSRFSDAFIVVGKVQRALGKLPESRDAYRTYLELAPLGTHAEEARAALATLPP
jgi:tetratricopeptide (TPR) repeat protein